MKRKRGAVLIVVLGVLAVLALLAVTFSTLQATERRVARNYLDTVRARLLARSGVEDAVARLQEYFPSRAFDVAGVAAPKPWKYWGNDLTETAEPGAVRLEEATNPSFAVEARPSNSVESPQDPLDPNVRPLQLRIAGKDRGLSGVMASGTYGTYGDHYALKVSDLSGRLFVNDGLDGGPQGSVSLNLKRILNVLGQIPGVSVPQLGDKVLAARPASGYRHANELIIALGDEAAWARVREFVTVDAWVDPNVANPVPLSAAIASEYPVPYFRGSPALYRSGRGKDAKGTRLQGDLTTVPPSQPSDPAIRVYGLDELNPQWIEIVRRAPVNVNTAAREVLVALLSDLKGFFLTDRRRNNPVWSGGPYLAFTQQNTFSPDNTEGDEYGFLVQTLPIVGPGSTATGISAFDVADEIVACRNRRATKSFNYATIPWGGPFRSWRQFYQFVDNLVAIGVIADPRPIFFDHSENTAEPTGHGPLIPSAFQSKHGAQAIADVLKANFNPNLHLNELNPDENLHLIVDKTDLIVNSSEFCFLPTGAFEIQSLGRVLRPELGYSDCRLSPDNELTAQAKVTAVVKLYDVVRETNQRQFAAGERGPIGKDTNSGRPLEVGPEPENGLFPGSFGAPGEPDNEWGGYVSLSTVGGHHHGGTVEKPNNTLWTTLRDVPVRPHLESAFHVHYALDHDAHHHQLGNDARAEIASRTNPDENVENWPDPLPGGGDAGYAGPYGPASGPGNAHRLARSFRLGRSGGTMPALQAAAPSDLRIDGAYSERNAAPAYAASRSGTSLWQYDTDPAQGMVSFWYKPSFAPERTGKIRVPWDFSRYHEPCWGCHVYPFAMWFFPVQFNHGLAEVSVPFYGWGNESMGRFRTCSIVWGHCQWHTVPTMSWFGNMSDTLNHRLHPDQDIKSNPLSGRRWIHFTMTWFLNGWEYGGRSSRLFINGSTKKVPFNWASIRPGDPTGGDTLMHQWAAHDGGDTNHIRMGGPSTIGKAPGTPWRGNYAADGTVDEVYVWNREEAVDPLTLWLRGRYYVPRAPEEATFTSQAITIEAGTRRAPAPPSQVTGGSQPLPPSRIRVLGVTWTWYGEGTDANGIPVLYDYSSTGADYSVMTPPPDVGPKVRLGIKDGAVAYGPFDDDSFSPVRDPSGNVPQIQDPTRVKYFAEFRLEKATPLDTILLATPVLDDVTLFWDDGGPQLLSYVLDSRSF